MTQSDHGSDDQPRRQCPFAPSRGFATDDARREYLKMKGLVHGCVDETLEADVDPSKPLYYWQLYSLLGTRAIWDVCEAFYRRVYDDESAAWFKDIFVASASQQHHINAQTAYWVDAFGGGRRYMGGNTRLTFHHLHNAAQIMNDKGAKQWMHYMKESLKENRHYFEKDSRILPCIVDFLETKMEAYANFHKWTFDPSDFKLSDFEIEDAEIGEKVQRQV